MNESTNNKLLNTTKRFHCNWNIHNWRVLLRFEVNTRHITGAIDPLCKCQEIKGRFKVPRRFKRPKPLVRTCSPFSGDADMQRPSPSIVGETIDPCLCILGWATMKAFLRAYYGGLTSWRLCLNDKRFLASGFFLRDNLKVASTVYCPPFALREVERLCFLISFNNWSIPFVTVTTGII